MSFVCVLEIELHFPETGSLKGKRKEITSVKAHIQRRFGAAVAETGHHDLWQRAALTAAVVGRDARTACEAAAGVERYLRARFPDGASFQRGVLSAEEVLG